MRTIWKYQVHVIDAPQSFLVPGFKGVAHVADQDGFANMVTVWCHVDSDEPEEMIKFVVTGTGHPIPQEKEWLFAGTALCGSYVWHLWSLK